MITASWTTMQTFLTILLLIAGVVDDLRTQKVHNQLIIAVFSIALIFVVSTQGLQGLLLATLSMLTAALAIVPLYMMRVLGGGDVKLFLAVSPLLGWQEILLTLLASMIWGSILGIFQVVLKGQIKSFSQNLLAIFHRSRLPEQSVHKMPFTVALFFGYLSSLVWMRGVV
jgi:prepilin peptidase CpaA